MKSRNQYIQEVRKEYIGASKEEKHELLNEVKKRTGMNRKYLIRKMSPAASYETTQRKKRAVKYGGDVRATLVRIWEIFDYPCGQRFAPILKGGMVKRLRELNEVSCGDTIAKKLQNMGSATIDRLLKYERNERQMNRYRGAKIHPLLYQKIPVKTSDEWDREIVGNMQVDYVENCGSSSAGSFVNTLSVTDIGTGWWEGQALIGRSQAETHKGLQSIQGRLPFTILEIHPDNDSGIINHLIYRYCIENKIRFSRSRPNKKNDNAWVEQKNYTHVRKLVGYLRFDTKREQNLLNVLYRDFALYRNFCQPTMKLIRKERYGGHVKRKYDVPRTPYERLLELGNLTKEKRTQLKAFANSLNPAALKRSIEKKRQLLYGLYQKKMKSNYASPFKKQSPRTVTFSMIQQLPSWLPT